jgi:hypothetical protein
MKISITITKEEKNRAENSIIVDPCMHIECCEIDCNNCPLREVAEELRKAQENFNKVLQSIEEE